MPVVPFRAKPVTHAPIERWRVVLVKGDRTRLYEILPGGAPGAVQTWVRINGKPHRALLLRDEPRRVAEIRAQYVREIAELELDGWARVESGSRRTSPLAPGVPLREPSGTRDG